MKRFELDPKEKIDGKKADIFALGLIGLVLKNKSMKASNFSNLKDGETKINMEI